MRKRLDPWKGKHLSSGGRLVLTNSCLSSLHMYMMGFYLLTGGKGANNNTKYHMAKWDMVIRPRDHGGLGILGTKLMNECLLTKWI
ncbi:hypothetical protein U9M48_036900 [Paspalum notatum var. saurae]|uniref:Uncharacterized protein n=1 Tax=Paspalum notatum var. saurae TaxID=547442 RepID=A0AAQ3UEK4_PASNO